jgi:hypothetical protein
MRVRRVTPTQSVAFTLPAWFETVFHEAARGMANWKVVVNLGVTLNASAQD